MRMWITKRTGILWMLAMFVGCAQGAFAQWAPMVQDAHAQARIAWWREARFGMFLHWGVYSVLGRGEWAQWNEQIPVDEYAQLANRFDPKHYDPKAWAELAKEGGMKYMILTARHHDGFALFNDPGSNFTAMKSAAHRDLISEYVKAVKSEGLHVGLYYSPLDWRFPGFFFPGIYRASADKLRAQYQRQVNELGSNYGKIDILWFDGGGDEWLGFGGVEFGGGKGWHGRPKGQPYTGKFDWQDDKTVAHLRQLQPQIIINDRTDAPADFRSREGDSALGGFENQFPWELCDTITDGPWGYDPDAKVKPLTKLIHLLVGAAGRDGNFLLNVSPMPDGEIPAAQAERVRQIGAWLKENGESIYGTRGGPWLPGAYGVSTHKGKVVYIHLLQAPSQDTLSLPLLPARVLSARLLNGEVLKFSEANGSLLVQIPESDLQPMDTILKLELDRPWTTLAVVPVPKRNN